MDDQCLRVRAINSGETVLLVWPPDFSATLESNTIHVIQGLVSGFRQEYDLQLGSQINIGGGIADSVDPSFFQVSATSCAGPFWVFGGLGKQ